MAGPIIIPNCVEVRLKWTTQGIAFFNVAHAQYTLAGPVNPGVGESIFAALKAAAGTTTWLGFLNTATSFLGVGVRDLRTPNNPELESTGAATVGTAGSGSLPQQNAIAVTLRTAFAGKAFRGRLYLGGLAQNAAGGDGKIASSAMPAASGFVTALQAALAAQSMTLAVGQKHLPPRTDKAGNTLPDRPANVILVTQILVLNNRMDTQRRRLQ